MSRSKHRQSRIFGWNPPPIPEGMDTPLGQTPPVASATECTGLSRKPVQDQREAEQLSNLYGIHDLKPQGNIGKGNPRNDPSEIGFHRGGQ
ncbi:MAG: hypothetical protein IJD94_01310 [Clostridia bacterium]|nr:hypothetical protein [Clostridia bacterium]